MSRVLHAALLLASGCAAAPLPRIPAPETPRAEYYNAPAPTPSLGAFETDLLRRLNDYLLARSLKPLTLDPALCRTGLDYTGAALRAGKRPPAVLIDYLLHHAGVTEPHPILFHAVFPVESANEFPSRFELQLPRLLAHPATDVGIAALRAGDLVAVTLVVLDRAARLQSVPQRLAPGSVVPVRGRLAETHRSPALMVTTPKGAFRRIELPVHDGEFQGQVSLEDGPGTYTVEVVAVGPLGPTVVSLFPIYCGVAPPARLEVPARIIDTPDEPGAAEARLVSLINEERARLSLPPLRANARLADVARSHSAEMVRDGFVGHRSPKTGLLSDRLKSAGIPADVSLENIARHDTLAGAHHGLMASPGHRRNILDPRVTEIGVGVVYSGSGPNRELFVTQAFVLPVAIVDPQTKRREIWREVQERRRGAGLPELDRDEVLEEVASEAARRVLAAGSIDSAQGQSFIAAKLRTRSYPYRTLTAQFLVASGTDKPAESVAWTRSGNWRAGIGVAQRPKSAFGEYALCLVVLLADGRNP
jgi:uncharacterized protein YkwD